MIFEMLYFFTMANYLKLLGALYVSGSVLPFGPEGPWIKTAQGWKISCYTCALGQGTLNTLLCFINNINQSVSDAYQLWGLLQSKCL